MSEAKGVLIHAFGNEGIDYYLLADGAAKLARKHLNLPIAVITDKPYAIKEADYLIEASSEIQQQRTLRNLKYNYQNDTRVHSYELTPFDQTLLIDSDYLMFGDECEWWFWTEYDFIAPTMIITPGRGAETKYIYNGIIQAWATTVYFRKSEYAENVFKHWKMIQDNYEYYRNVMNVYGNYRNDYSLSAALHATNGYTPNYSNWNKLTTIPTTHQVVDINFKTNKVIVGTPTDKIITYINNNLHIMDKVRLCEIFTEKWVT
jgi:hypothetical protein